MQVHQRHAEPWRVTLVDTGEDTKTGGRLRRVAEYLKGEDAFCFTYGDGVGDMDVTQSIAFHKEHGKLATLTVIQPPGRFGSPASGRRGHNGGGVGQGDADQEPPAAGRCGEMAFRYA